MRIINLIAVSAAVAMSVGLPGVRAQENDTPKLVPPEIRTDTEIFRRTPVIDGVVEAGEWDSFYGFSAGGWEAQTYVNWDAGHLYIGCRSNRPVDLLAVLDARADGWFPGEDNYEFRTRTGEGGVVYLTVSRYESRNTKSPEAVPVSPDETTIVCIKSTRTDNVFMMEMGIPSELLRGLSLTSDKPVGLQVNICAVDGSSSWVPSAELGDTKECRLVTKKLASLKPLELGFDLRDRSVARGEELVGKFHLTNTGSETADVRSYIIAGEGKAGEFLGSEKVRMDGLPPKKHHAHEIRTLIPRDMSLGSWAIGAEVRSGAERLGSALMSFDVVDPFDVELRLPTGDVRADVKDVTFAVTIKNNTRRQVRGVARIALPVGWELWKNADTREVSVRPGTRGSAATFKAKPPLGAVGDIPVKVDVTVDGLIKTAEGKILLVNP